MVNTQQLQGSWNRLKGQVKEKWGNLTDEDLQMQGGNVDQLVGTIQQRTGESREAIEQFLNDLTSRGSSTVSQAAEKVGQYAQDAMQQARDQFRDRRQELTDQFGDGYERMERAVQQNPTQSVAAALGVGLVLGIMVGLALRSR